MIILIFEGILCKDWCQTWKGTVDKSHKMSVLNWRLGCWCQNLYSWKGLVPKPLFLKGTGAKTSTFERDWCQNRYSWKGLVPKPLFLKGGWSKPLFLKGAGVENLYSWKGGWCQNLSSRKGLVPKPLFLKGGWCQNLYSWKGPGVKTSILERDLVSKPLFLEGSGVKTSILDRVWCQNLYSWKGLVSKPLLKGGWWWQILFLKWGWCQKWLPLDLYKWLKNLEFD